jgi:hypothetical protein
MNRNIILYVLVALLVVVGGTWFVLGERRAGEPVREERDTGVEEARDEESAIEEVADGDGIPEGMDTGVGASVNGEPSNEPQAADAVAAPVPVDRTTDVGVGVTERVEHTLKQELASDLNIQLQIASALITIIDLQLEAGDISAEEAGDLLESLSKVVNTLEVSVEAYLAL